MAASNSRLSSKMATDSASPSPADSNLSLPPPHRYSQAGYSSADPSEYESETPKEDTVDYQQGVVHEQSPPLISPHGIHHRRLSHRHVEHSRPAVQDTKWKLYDPQPLLSNLVHHDKHTPVESDLYKSPERESAKHHLWHYYHQHHQHHDHHHDDAKKQSQPDDLAGSGIDRPHVQFRTPAYDKSHYTFSAAGNNTRLLLQQDSTLGPQPLLSPHETSWEQDIDQFPGPDNEADTESDSSPPKPVFLRRRSSTNYQTELNTRRAEGRHDLVDDAASSPSTTSSVKALEDRVSAVKIGGPRGDHTVAVPPPVSTRQYKTALPSKYYSNPKANTLNHTELSRDPSESDEERPLYAHDSGTHHIPREIEDDFLRRKSADSEFESIEAFTMAGTVKPEPEHDDEAKSPRLMFQTRKSSFDYNDYKSHFHGLLMTPEQETKPGFSCKD
ncbi:hypothetical protein V1509DRAFT_615051 [Lipomyces kononenkoae]